MTKRRDVLAFRAVAALGILALTVAPAIAWVIPLGDDFNSGTPADGTLFGPTVIMDAPLTTQDS